MGVQTQGRSNRISEDKYTPNWDSDTVLTPQACKFCTLDKSVDPKTHAVGKLEESDEKERFFQKSITDDPR